MTNVIRWMGDDRILWESDFPHRDSKYPHVTQEFIDLLPEEVCVDGKRQIPGDNAIAFDRIVPDDDLPEVFTTLRPNPFSLLPKCLNWRDLL